MGKSLIVRNNIDAGTGGSFTEYPTAFKIEHCHFPFITTNKDKAAFFIERYSTRTFAPVELSADNSAASKIDSESSATP